MHLMAADKMQGMVPSFIPGGVIWVYITGVLLILGASGFVINKSVQLAGYLLGGLMLIFILTIHLPVVIGGDQNGMGSLLKNFVADISNRHREDNPETDKGMNGH